MSEIITVYVYPPIPIRAWDWCAYRDPEGMCGWGRTKEEAISELLEMEELA